MKTPLVSIILPTHNRADVLAFAISSCLAQTVPDFELLAVGDGCTDTTAKVVAAIPDRRVRWFDRPKQPGFGYEHRNFALREARGEFIAWQAHDDLWLPDHLERMLRLFDAGETAWAHSRPTWITPEGRICPSSFFLDDPETRRLFLAMQESLLHSNCVVHRRDCVERFGVWNAALPSSGDWDYWARIIREGGAMAVLPDITTLHFRAVWRTDSNFAGARLQPMLDWHAQGGPDRDALRIVVPSGVSEQEAAWREIERDAAGWPARVRRAAVRADLSRLATQEQDGRLALQEEERRLAIQEEEALNAVTGTSIRARYWRARGRLVSSLRRLKS